jgi:hypothetical protein
MYSYEIPPGMRMRNAPGKFVEKIQTHIVFNFFSLENRAVDDNAEKYGKAGQATNDNTTHAQCIVNN